MAPKIQLALTPFAFVLDGFCGMIDEETTGPQVEAALLAAILDDPPDKPLIPVYMGIPNVRDRPLHFVVLAEKAAEGRIRSR